MPGRPSILLVDDHAQNLLALEAVLEPLGVDCVRARSGFEALREVLRREFAAILLDVQMPEMDGLETAALIKRRTDSRDVPIIFVTGHDGEAATITRAFTMGAVDYVVKPYEPELLRSKVRSLVALYRKDAELRESEARFRATFEHAPIGIALLDAECRWLDANRALADMLGRPTGELVAAPPFDLRNLVNAEGANEFAELLAGSRRSFSVERRLFSASVNTVWASINVSRVNDSNGALLHLICQVADVTERRTAEESLSARIAFLAYHDELTGLPNRATLREHLDLALARAGRHGSGVAILNLDLNRFKLVNDSLGHAAGDELLRQVAGRLATRTRSTDLLARHGGDEFMLLLGDLDSDARATAERVAHGLLATLEQPFTLEGHEFEIAASIGIAIHPDDGADMSDVLKRADAALYEAKRGGRGTIRFAAAEQVTAAGQLTLTARLRRALAREEFELYYQPVYSVATREVVAVEALLRWQDPERGMVPPLDFIPGAEDSGLIEPIGDWVVDAVIAQAARWHELGLRPDIAFNVSPRQLRSDGFADRLLARLEGLDATQFIAEITESAAMADPEYTVPLLERLAAAGLRLAIDDFGADFSSLARLRDLPVHELKIDRSFLRDVPGDERSAAIVTAMVRLAKALELTCVAEGVEHADQLEFLAAHDCALAQGFHLARPLPECLVTPLLQPSPARK